MEAYLKNRILLIGGGGHCHSVLDSILSLNAYAGVGIIDNSDRSFLNIPVVGTDEDIPRLRAEGWTDAFITVGSVGDTRLRHKLYEMVKSIGLNTNETLSPTLASILFSTSTP